MSYLLDTNVVIAMLRDRPPAVRSRFRRASADAPILLSSVALFELWYGVARSTRQRKNTEQLRAFLSGPVTVLPFEEEDAAAAGDLRAQLEAAGNSIGPYDLLIAAQALRVAATLVTTNAAEFARVPGLTWEDWSAET